MKFISSTVNETNVHIMLNRPDALNSLTLGMTREIGSILREYSSDPDIKAFFVEGAGDRAFCAGGDLKSLYESGLAFKGDQHQENFAAVFFSEEYALNQQIKFLSKPYISYLNGITMGGGYGVSGHGSHLIATPSTKFAMPEVKIGFFPDVGATYNLSKCPHHIGVYLAMTGVTINAQDMVFVGLANMLVDPQKNDFEIIIESIMKKLLAANHSLDIQSQCDLIDQVLQELSSPIDLEASQLYQNRERIEACFGLNSVAEIIDALQKDNSDWALRALDDLHYGSPISVHIAFEQMRRVKTMRFEEVMAQDLNLAHHFILGTDLYEGIRETVIDKTKNPKWQHETLLDVQKEDIDKYFQPVNLL